MPDTPLFSHGHLRIRACRHGLMLYTVHDIYIGQALDRYGEAFEDELSFLGQAVKPGMTVLDIGSHLGTHAVYFARQVGPTGRVLAFEPQPFLHHLLCANLALNGLSWAHPRLCALGAEPGVVHVPVLDYARPGNYGGLELDPAAPAGAGTVAVPLARVDDLDLAACHFMKIDVEGMEAQVLRGAQDAIRRFRPLLYVENQRPRNSAGLVSALLALDLRLYWHFTPLWNPANHFRDPENAYPHILSANLLCVPRERGATVLHLPEVAGPEEDWKTALARWTGDRPPGRP